MATIAVGVTSVTRTIVGIILLFKFVPEARGRTLNELEDDFRTAARGQSVGAGRAAAQRS